MNENWPRWIFASCSKHFDSGITDIPVFFEGQKRNDAFSEGDLIEFRMDGPHFFQLGHNTWETTIEINILTQ